MKNFKLWVHQKAFSEDDLVINPKEFPDVKIGDILEIYHPDEESSHLLLEVKSFKDDLQQSSKEIVSVEQGVASLFQLRAYKAVKVNKVQLEDVALDLVELVFKDQYISRSDMWRLKNSMVNTCIHIQQKVELSGVRAQVQELWSGGEKVSCGAITSDTKVAFRSATAMVYMFIQMSSEMWDFDVNGDLYWEKAVSGFLTDLFNKWREKGVNHEVTVVLFSRTFFMADSLEEFPESMRAHIKSDFAGRLYQDFYRVVVQHERREEWHPFLITLKCHFSSYLEDVMCQTKPNGPIPQGYNSTAAEGNFLETLNMTLNVFDKHYIDRNFERTGQLVVLLTPGPGVFEVDREMCKITRQRMIDYGIGSDLVCLAEQPLHAVPLFKFHNKSKETSLLGGDYNIPHWLNHSFYTKDESQARKGHFKPRIKLADKQVSSLQTKEALPYLDKRQGESGSMHRIPTDHSFTKSDDIDYRCEEYDADIFKIPSGKSPRPRTPSSMRPPTTSYLSRQKSQDPQAPDMSHWTKADRSSKEINYRHGSPGSGRGSYHSDCGASAIAIPGRSAKAYPFSRLQKEANVLSQSFEAVKTQGSAENHSESPQGIIVGSAGAIHDKEAQLGHPGQNVPRALVNPFGTSNLAVKLTSNRRRWTHTFPQGPSGGAIQVHHRSQSHNHHHHHHHHRIHRNSSNLASTPPSPHQYGGYATPRTPSEGPALMSRSGSDQRLHPSASGNSLFSNGSSPSLDNVLHRPSNSSDFGVDWKSLTATACFPVTTDFYPDRLSLEWDFVEFNYELLAEEDIKGPFMTVDAIFQELISQRLLQGFQLVVLPSSVLAATSRSQRHPPLVTNVEKEEYVMSIGRIFHKLRLHKEKKTISVTMYRPRHPSLCEPIQYTYQLWSVQNEGYQPTQTIFQHEVIERYNWNYLDNYISVHDSDFTLVDSLKFWRSRFMLIPNTSLLMKRYGEETGVNHPEWAACKEDEAFQHFHVDVFLRFMEMLNGIRRQTSTSRGPRASISVPSSGRQTPTSTASDHHLLTKVPTAPSPINVMERQRHGSGTGGTLHQSPSLHLLADDSAPKLSLCTPLQIIAKAMTDISKGVQFLPLGPKGLPTHCFVAGEAVAWVRKTLIGDVTELEAHELLQNMQECKLIQHASGHAHIPFIRGFYIYRLMLPENVPPMTDPTKNHGWRDYVPLTEYIPEFQSNWFEVAVMEELSWKQKATAVCGSIPSQEAYQSPWAMHEMAGVQGSGSATSHSSVTNRDFKPPETRSVMLEIDCNKTDRVEWCHVTYHGNFNVERAFDLQVEWLVCTPSLLNDLLQGWARKANSLGFHLVPAPLDPFHQHPDYSNPLRCPLFIPLDIPSLSGEGGGREQTDMGIQPGDKSLELFQDLLMKKFGFILSRDKRWSSFDGYGFHSTKLRPMEYIHQSGVCFVSLVNSASDILTTTNLPTTLKGQGSQVKVIKARQQPDRVGTPIMVGRDGNFDIVGSKSEVVGEEEQRDCSDSIHLWDQDMLSGHSVGFFWSRNHMQTKKWRSGGGDDKLHDSMLKDFSEMCENVSGRLTEFWLQKKDLLRL